MPAVNLLACVMIAAILNTPAIVMSGGPTLNHVQEQAHGEVVNLLGIWRGASFADVIPRTGFGEPGTGARRRDEDTHLAAQA